jgi:hypothetical protein
MPQLTYSVTVQIPNGPTIAETRPVSVEAYDKIELDLPPAGAAAAAVKVNLQPVDAASVSVLVVKSSIYDPSIKCTLNDGAGDAPANDSAEIALDAPIVLLGSSLLLTKIAAPKVLKLKNTFAADQPAKKAVIEVLVARKAK